MSCVAITLGPLSNTLGLTTSPAGLWAASGIFSYLAESICRNVEKIFADAVIINPIHKSKDGDKYEIAKDGIGKYHDRIFFFTDADSDTVKENMKKITTTVFEDIADGLSKAMNLNDEKKDIVDFLEDYLTVHYVIDQNLKYDSENQENFIIRLSPYLDSLEWTGKYIPSIKKNYLLDFFEGKENDRNKFIKGSFLIPEEKDFQVLNKNKNVRNIEEIANPNDDNPQDMKYSGYYAVVKADGDKMGKILKNVVGGDFDRLKQFSQFCREYLTRSAHSVGEYGGLTIFAGGDDLMFLAPVKNGDKNIFSLISEINKAFNDALKQKQDGGSSLEELINDHNDNKGTDEETIAPPTLSFGVSLQYVKYPLKEAVRQAGDLLRIAKENGGDSIAYNLRKNSGQNCQLCYSFGSCHESTLNDLIDALYKNDADIDAVNKSFHSILYHLRAGTTDTQESKDGNYRKSTYELIIDHIIYSELDQKELLLEKVFDNLFDNSVQKQAKIFLKQIQKALLNGIKYHDVLQMMWTAKFFVERREKRDENAGV